MKKRIGLIALCTLVFLTCGCETKKCNDGERLKDNKCISVDVKPAKIKYSCKNENYKLDEADNNSCVLIENSDVIVTNNCTTGYTYNSNKDRCEKYQYTDYQITKTCTVGERVGDKCIDTWVRNALKNYKCPSRYTYTGGKCKYNDYFIVEPTITYYCSGGLGRLEGDKCIVENEFSLTEKKTCPSDYTDNNGNCKKLIYENVNKTYSCTDGYELENNMCIKKNIVESNKKYYCETDDYILEKQECIKYLN